MNERTQAIFFDLDNCLFDTSAMKSMKLFDPIFQQIGTWGADTTLKVMVERALWNGAPQDTIGDMDYLTAGQRTDLLTWYDQLPVPEEAALYTDSLPFLEAISAKPNRPTLILVTKGLNGFQRSKITHLGIERFFDHIQITGDAKWSAYETKYLAFGAFKQRLGFANASCIAVGDSAHDELLSGARLGMTTVQTVRPGVTPDPQTVRRITSLDQLWQYINI